MTNADDSDPRMAHEVRDENQWTLSGITEGQWLPAISGIAHTRTEFLRKRVLCLA